MQSSETIQFPEKIAIIGNGFDLAIGAKTTYSEFYDCLKSCFDSTSLDEFKNHYISEDNELLVNAFYETVVKNKENFFINYFLNYQRVFGNWVAFEKELTNIIECFDELASCLNESDKTYFIDAGDHVRTYVRIFDKTNLLQVLSVYPRNRFFSVGLSPMQFRDDEQGVAIPIKIEGKTFKNMYEAYKGFSNFSEEFPMELYKDLVVFSGLFSIYLGIVNHFAEFNRIIKDAFESTVFINYNFTNYLEKIMQENGLTSRAILHINGLAENINGKPEDKIVFGIDSNTKLSNLGFEIFTKRIQRSIKETDVARLTKSLAFCCEEIYVIGHSLNLADLESLGFIFSKCEEQGKPTITIYYYDAQARIDLIINLKSILGNNKFDEYQREGLINLVKSASAWINI